MRNKFAGVKIRRTFDSSTTTKTNDMTTVTLYRGDTDNNKDVVTAAEFTATNYNRGGVNKNPAQLYFLSNTLAYASEYGSNISVWGFTGNVLDLSLETNRALLAPYFEELCRQNDTTLIANCTYFMSIRKSKADQRDLSAKIAAAKARLAAALTSDAMRVLATQDVADNENGLMLKAALIELGYDGVCFSESNKGATYCLINRPTLIN
jgi:hypothetical protein